MPVTAWKMLSELQALDKPDGQDAINVSITADLVLATKTNTVIAIGRLLSLSSCLGSGR